MLNQPKEGWHRRVEEDIELLSNPLWLWYNKNLFKQMKISP